MSTSASAAPPPALECRSICKRFGEVVANDAVSLKVAPGSIHGIVGENGAGKSTLVSILYGFYTADSGSIALNGSQVRITSAQEAISHGIGMVHQHFMLVPNFTVLENIMLGHEGSARLDHGAARARRKLAQLSDAYGLSIEPDAITGALPVGLQQRVEILKALYRGARLLILDEPTGVLTPQETEQLFAILRALKAEGVTILLITHKLKEIMAVTDSVSVMRQGCLLDTLKTADTSPPQLAELMVGRKVLLTTDRNKGNTPSAYAGRVILAADRLGYRDAAGTERLRDISFRLHSGEILGIAGVAGNGQSELLSVLAGITPPTTGHLTVAGQQIDGTHPADPALMRRLGMAHVPEDRHQQGMVLAFTAAETAQLGYPERLGGGVLLDPKKSYRHCRRLMQDFDIRPPDPNLRSSQFSGGNQQKIVLAREMDAEPDILLVGQPTRGVDIGAIEFIHRQLISRRDAGCAILLVSVELDEILGLADRIMVMNNGAIIGTMDREDADERTLGLMMAGVAAETSQQDWKAD